MRLQGKSLKTQITGAEQFVIAHDHAAMNPVDEFANIARPVIGVHRAHGFGSESSHRGISLNRHKIFQNSIRQYANVAITLPQGG